VLYTLARSGRELEKSTAEDQGAGCTVHASENAEFSAAFFCQSWVHNAGTMGVQSRGPQGHSSIGEHVAGFENIRAVNVMGLWKECRGVTSHDGNETT